MYYVNENIKNLYRVKFHDERKDYLRLDMNENPEGLPADFVEEIKKKIEVNENGLRKYSKKNPPKSRGKGKCNQPGTLYDETAFYIKR